MSTTYFNQASHLAIENVQIYHHTTHLKSKGAFDLLLERVAIGALSNSDERCDAPKCHPDTRVAVQQEIVSWAAEGKRDSPSGAKNIMWLSGPAGTGKSAIAGSVADTCKERGLLAASFFFSSYAAATNRRSKKFLVPTIAYQLLRHESFSGIKEEILASVEKDPTIFDMQLKDQLQELVLNPLRAIQTRMRKGSDGVPPKIVIIDGLDECEADLLHVEDRHKREHRRRSAADQLEVLSALHQASLDPAFPFRILIVSRPESAIIGFLQSSGGSISSEIFLDERYAPNADIALFLRSKFSDLCRRYQIPTSWPGEGAIRMLVERASGQFIYAATAIRFVEDGSHTPQEQLQRILDVSTKSSATSPFADLDALYSRILLGSPEPRHSAAWILSFDSLICLTASTTRSDSRESIWIAKYCPAVFFRQFFERRPGEAERLLGNLRAIISIPAPDDQESCYRVWHKSLNDYLVDPVRCRRAGFPFSPDPSEWRSAYYRCREVRRPPAYPELDSSSLDIFRNRFMCLIIRFYPFSNHQRAPRPAINQEALRQLVRDQLSIKDENVVGIRTMVRRYYINVHVHCHWSGLWCTEECKAWRSAIKSAFRANEWKTPSAVDLVLEALIALRYKRGDAKRITATVKSWKTWNQTPLPVRFTALS